MTDYIDWRQRAACRAADPELWHSPDGPEKATAREAREQLALSYCDICPVKAECLADVIARGDRDAIAGGTTPEQRDAARREERTPCGTTSGWRRHRQHGETPCEPCQAAYDARPVSEPRKRSIITCHDCGRVGRNASRGLCSTCYRRRSVLGTINDVPRTRDRQADRHAS